MDGARGSGRERPLSAEVRRSGCPFHAGARTATSDTHAKPVPGPRGYRLLGSLLEVRRDRIAFVESAVREHGDAVAFRMGPKRLFLLAHPEHFRRVLVENPDNYRKGIGLIEARRFLGGGLLTGEDEAAAAERRCLQPAFRRDRIDGFDAAMVEATDSMLARWDALEDGARTVDVEREMAGLALEILGSTLLGADLRAAAREISEDLETLGRWAIRQMTALVRLPFWASGRARRAYARIDGLARELLQERQRHEDDLLAALLGSGEDEAKVRDELLTLLLAGHETAAATLTWTWHLLGEHPEAESRLCHELDRVLDGRAPSAADLPRLTYARALIEEVLRLYPPVWLIPRRAVAADEARGCAIPAGTDVLLSVYSMHRHPELWERPERFEPQRFAASTAGPAAFGFLPFGAGPRSCLGGRFALLETTLVLARVAQRYRLETVPGRPVETEALLTLRPRGGLAMRLCRKRTTTRGGCRPAAAASL